MRSTLHRTVGCDLHKRWTVTQPRTNQNGQRLHCGGKRGFHVHFRNPKFPFLQDGEARRKLEKEPVVRLNMQSSHAEKNRKETRRQLWREKDSDATSHQPEWSTATLRW